MSDDKSTNPSSYDHLLKINTALSDAIRKIDNNDEDKDIHLWHIDEDDFESAPSGTPETAAELDKANEQPEKSSDQTTYEPFDETARYD